MLVTLTVRKPKSPEFKGKVLDAVHASLVSTGVPDTDKFQRQNKPAAIVIVHFVRSARCRNENSETWKSRPSAWAAWA
jgi:hypothetical protein